jgi:hypothetical protein
MMDRDDPEKGNLETDFRGGQGPPRAVAPRKKKKKKKNLNVPRSQHDNIAVRPHWSFLRTHPSL